MSEDPLDLIGREELLGGSLAPGRRAGTLLFAIEGRVAHLVAQTRDASNWYRTQQQVEEREKSFLEALRSGHDLPLQPAIQDMERYAEDWADLVAKTDDGLRAALARALGRDYTFTYEDIPKIRTNLRLDDAAVQQAFERYYNEPVSSIYSVTVRRSDRLRWLGAAIGDRLESLPPFWLALLLTLPGAAGLLALPIALAGVSLSTALVILIAFGLINMLTAAALAESTARSGTARFGLGFLGQLAQEYLGNAGAGLLTIVMGLNNFFVLIIFFVAVAGTLQESTTLPSELWIVAIFAVCFYFLSRGTFNATVATTLVIIFVSLAIIIIIPLLALPYFQIGSLQWAGLSTVSSELKDPATWSLLLGVMLSTFFSHILIAAYGPVVIRHDPGARSWIAGSASAIIFHTMVACLWVIIINGAVPADTLAATTTTVLAPLSELVGPSVIWLGSALVILSLGLAAVQISLGLFYQVMEFMPGSKSTSFLGRLGQRGRFWLAIAPVIGVFILAEVVAITQTGSFAGMLGYVSGLSLPLVGGIFPVLVLAATRRKGDLVPASVSRILGHPITISLIYLFFLGAIFAYGFFIYSSLLERLSYVVFGIIVALVTLIMLRHGALRHRTVVELRADYTPEGHHQFHVTSNGKPLKADVHLTFKNSEVRFMTDSGQIAKMEDLIMAEFKLPSSGARELKVWAHQFTPEGISEPLPITLRLEDGSTPKSYKLFEMGGQTIQPLSDKGGMVTLTVSGRSPGGYSFGSLDIS